MILCYNIIIVDIEYQYDVDIGSYIIIIIYILSVKLSNLHELTRTAGIETTAPCLLFTLKV